MAGLALDSSPDRPKLALPFSRGAPQVRLGVEVPRSRGRRSAVSVLPPWAGPVSAFIARDRAFPRKPDGTPQFHNNHAYHIENKKLVGWQALPKLALFFGPTVHVSATNDACCGGQVSQFDGGERLWTSGANIVRFGPGLTGGIRAF